jgi:hypothetical protein
VLQFWYTCSEFESQIFSCVEKLGSDFLALQTPNHGVNSPPELGLETCDRTSRNANLYNL